MKVTRVFCPHNKLVVGADFTLDERGSRHIVQVMRLRKGDLLVVFNGEAPGEYLAEIVATTKREAMVKIIQSMPGIEAPSLHVHLAQAVSRGERMDYAIQKSVELGVSVITPILTERCGVKVDAHRERKRIAHWQGVANSAAEQSGRCEVPVIQPIKRLDSWLSSIDCNKKWVAMPVVPDQQECADSIQEAPASLAVLIGPEGGLTNVECQLAVDHQFEAVQFGPRVLRTETAPVVALTLAQLRWGDF